MSFIEKIQNLFKPQNKLPEDSMDMASVGMPVDPFATGAMNVAGNHTSPDATAHMMATQFETDKESAAPSMMFADDAPAAAELNPELIKLPILGSKTIAQHQRIAIIRHLASKFSEKRRPCSVHVRSFSIYILGGTTTGSIAPRPSLVRVKPCLY